MNKIGQFLTTVVIGGFAIILVAMIVVASGRAASPVKGSIHAALEAVSAKNLHATAIAPSDVYGDDWVAAQVLCSGDSAEELAAQVGASIEELDIAAEVPEGSNYLMVLNREGKVYAEEFKTSEVNMCLQQAPGAFDANMMIPFIKDESGVWTLAS